MPEPRHRRATADPTTLSSQYTRADLPRKNYRPRAGAVDTLTDWCVPCLRAPEDHPRCTARGIDCRCPCREMPGA